MWIFPAKSFLFFRKIRISVFVVGVTKLANHLREICIHQLASRSQTKSHGEIWTLYFNRITVLLLLKDSFRAKAKLTEQKGGIEVKEFSRWVGVNCVHTSSFEIHEIGSPNTHF